MKNDLTTRLATTRDRAVAFVEDFRHLKEVYKNEYPDRVEIRHLSPLLRRLLLDGDLGAVAAPCRRKFSISAFDLRSFYHAPSRRFFSCRPKKTFIAMIFASSRLSAAYLQLHFQSADLKIYLR